MSGKMLLKLIGIIASVIGIGWLLFNILPDGIDWYAYFRPAAREMAFGRSPYSVKGFYNPPWMLLPILPIAFLPERWGHVILVMINFAAYAYILIKLGAKPISLIAVLLSPFFLYGLLKTNMDWLVVLGFVMPAQIGLFFVLSKPQIGIAVAIFWLVEAYRKGKVREVIRVFAPVTAAFVFSIVLWGLYFIEARNIVNVHWNQSIWPVGIPIGLVLLVEALRHRKIGYAIIASPFFAPYLAINGWTVAFLGLLPGQWETVIAVIGSWLLVFAKIVT